VLARRVATLVSLLWAAACGAAGQSAPPQLAGVSLGATPQIVRTVLGPPDRQEESLGMRFWDYERRGITLIWAEREAGVHGIVASRTEAGDVEGIRVGDREAQVRRKWGAPARVRQGGRFLDFIGATWVLSVELHRGRIVEITLMGAASP
jgi:hypothetical protein